MSEQGLDRRSLALVTGAGGFIGGHLVARLLADGFEHVRAVDCKPLERWYQRHDGGDNRVLDLMDPEACQAACDGAGYVFNLAADMGGMGFIERNRALCMLSVLVSTNMMRAAHQQGAARFFYSSSACVYAADKQETPEVSPLRESDAYPAMPEDGYGWEKLFSERMAWHFYEDFGFETRVARYHNVYGPCFDDQTEVLTADGWKYFSDVSMQDEIATLNQSSGELEYHRPSAIQAYDYRGPMYRVQHPAGDLLVTPDHSIYFAKRTSGCQTRTPFRLGRVSESGWNDARMYFTSAVHWLGGAEPSHHVLAESHGSDGRTLANRGGARKDIPLATWLRFAGWYLSEGSSWITPSNHTVCITQTRGPRQDEICETLMDMGFRPYVNGRNVIVSSKQLYEAVRQFGTGAHAKRLPRWYLMLPPHRLKELFGTLMAGDGDADGRRYTTTSRDLADAVMEIALKLGMRAWIGREGRLFRVHLSDRTTISTRRNHRTVEQYEGRVYDVTVNNHVLLVRRNGKPMWSGNCGTFDGGREKAPAAICRKVIEAKLSGSDEIEIWGDGLQTRSFTYIDDCLEGTMRLMASDVRQPINIGSSELVTVNELVSTVEEIAGVTLKRRYVLDAPQGVRGRNSDNTLIQDLLGWTPSTPLRDGMARTYAWIYDQMSSG